ncbi:hypothetical protein QFC19_003590 [Naganishia cerealis]|uniref:Uncharacterized protein n=1 Tax=Naganishia cerealis TaxID=610337 RepID=A0ACC2W209_9TREE|nr:hypothetical protein QFC19_003590 [Naganishia cerealis]
MNDTSGISVCFGSIQDQNLLAHAKAALKQMKAKWTSNIEIDTTHFVCQAAGPAENNYNPTAEYLKAVQLSLPIVQPQWVLACQIEKKLVPVSAFQLGADTPHKYQPQGNLVQEAEQGSKLQTAESAVVPESKSPKTEKASAVSSLEETARNADTANQDGAHASVQSPDAGPSIDPEMPPQQSNVVRDDSVNLHQQTGNSSPPAAPKSPKPEADGKLDRSFKFPVSSPPAEDESHTTGAQAASYSEFTASADDKATEDISAPLTEEDKAMQTQPLVEEPRTIDNDAAPSSQVTEDPVSASATEEPQAESTMSNPRRPEPKKTESDVDVAARQWLSGQKPVDAAAEHHDHSTKVLDEVLIKKAAAQAEKEAAVAAPVSTQPVETEELHQPPEEASATPEVEVQKDHGEVVKVAQEPSPQDIPAQIEAVPDVTSKNLSQTEATPNAEESVEIEGEVEETNEDEDQTPAESIAPTPSESPAPAEGETPVTGGSKKKKNKKKNKK